MAGVCIENSEVRNAYLILVGLPEKCLLVDYSP